MDQVVRRRAMILAILSLLLIPAQVAATDLDPGSPARGSHLAFTPDHVELEISEYVGGFVKPVHVTNAGDGSGRLFVSELAGVVRIVEDGQSTSGAVSGHQ